MAQEELYSIEHNGKFYISVSKDKYSSKRLYAHRFNSKEELSFEYDILEEIETGIQIVRRKVK